MSWLKQTFSSSIGSKTVVAVTGLIMVGFLVAHIAGNLLIFVGPEALAIYAEGLRKFPALLWFMRIGLIVATVFHVALALKLNWDNRAARPVPYAKKVYRRASFSSRSMVLTGLLLLFYVIYHLLHFTFRTTNAEIAALGPWDVYQMLIISFSNPLMSWTYIAAMVVMGLHLSHGVSSVFQTLGMNHPKYNGFFRLLGPVSGFGLAALYISIPVAVMLGLVK